MVSFPAKRPELCSCSVIQTAQGFRILLPSILSALLSPDPDGLKDLRKSTDKVFKPGHEVLPPSAEVVVMVRMDRKSPVIAL